MTNWFLEQTNADQARKERDELRQEIKTIRTLLTAIRLLTEGGNTDSALKLIRQLEEVLDHK